MRERGKKGEILRKVLPVIYNEFHLESAIASLITHSADISKRPRRRINFVCLPFLPLVATQKLCRLPLQWHYEKCTRLCDKILCAQERESAQKTRLMYFTVSRFTPFIQFDRWKTIMKLIYSMTTFMSLSGALYRKIIYFFFILISVKLNENFVVV